MTRIWKFQRCRLQPHEAQVTASDAAATSADEIAYSLEVIPTADPNGDRTYMLQVAMSEGALQH